MARAARILTVAFLLVLGAMPLSADGPPPRDLHKVGDHWTAWYPPADAPEGARVHIIEPGDTLWDLAARFYTNPYLWPQIWELNQYIQDAHWIYPGDPLVIGVEAVTQEELVAMGEEGEGEVGPGEGAVSDEVAFLTLEEALGDPVALGVRADLYCSGYIGDLEQDFGYRVIGSEYQVLQPRLNPTGVTYTQNSLEAGVYGTIDIERVTLSVGDIIYLDGGRQAGLSPGQVFNAIEPGREVRHPLSGELVGRHYVHLGQVRVLSVQDDTAIAEIFEACRPIVQGTVLEPFESEPVPLGRLQEHRPPTLPTAAENLNDAPVILHAQDAAFSLGQNHIVFIDRGENEDVIPGDIFTIYRTNAPGYPPVVLGELAVLAVRPSTAVARILASRYPIYVGDRLELK